MDPDLPVESYADWLPNRDRAVVPRAKVVDYLLAGNHPDGQSKARFFAGFGFSATDWGQFADALRRHAQEYRVRRVEDSPFGRRYVVEGILQAPDGRTPYMRTVWFIPTGGEIPWLVTAYPVPEPKNDP